MLRRDEAPIAALASGTGAVAVIRLSGTGSHDLIAKCIGGFAAWPERQLRHCCVREQGSGEVLDDVLAVLFKGPRSYTGQDSGEIHCHGGPYIVQRILTLLFHLGFRPAEPGEFTRRAFLNGKLDLTAAEGIHELVTAESHQQWHAARHLTSGKLRSVIEKLRDTLTGAMTYLEAQIDFPDEGDTAALHLGTVRQKVEDVHQQVKGLAESYAHGRVAARGLSVALLGAPNAGKSTLMNELLGRERAIVTAVPGTTRDYLEETCLINGRLIRLIDMAGLRESHDVVEAMGVATARRLAATADLVILLVPADAAPEDAAQAERWLKELQVATPVRVLTKVDLGRPSWGDGWLAISCRSGEGVQVLRDELVRRVDAHLGPLTQEAAFVTSARQHAALSRALEALTAFLAAAGRGAYEEMLAFELQEAAKAMAGIIGDVTSEDILAGVFSAFCIGK